MLERNWRRDRRPGPAELLEPPGSDGRSALKVRESESAPILDHELEAARHAEAPESEELRTR